MLTLREQLGRTIRHLRTQAGFSQERFADACALHRTYIGSVERGETNISLDNIALIARTLALPVSKLFAAAETER